MNVAVHSSELARRSALPLGQRVAVAGGAGALVGTAAALGASAPTSEQTLSALLRATIVAAPLAAALYAWDVKPFERFARLLAGVGVVSFLTTLAESREPALYSVGRGAGWTLELLLVILVLAFPDGPLRERSDRRLAAAMGAVVAVFYFPTLILTEHFQVPSPYTSCLHDCPRNVLFPLDREPPLATPLLLGTGSVLVFLITLFVLLRLRARIAAASAVQRRALVPVLVLCMLREGLVGTLILTRQTGAADEVVRIGATLIAWTTPAIAVAFLVGLVRMRLAAERSLRTLTESVRGAPDLPRLQDAAAEALDDPSLRLTVPVADAPHGWVDVDGEPASAPEQVPGKCLRWVRDGHDRTIASLRGDGALADRPELLDATTGLVAVALENRRLTDQAERAAGEVQASRARIAATADEERRRIERDLHDGAQQRLVALRIELSIVQDMLFDDPAAAASRIRELEVSAEEALEELRALAHGVRPPLLADRGMGEALRSAIARSGLPAMLDDQGAGRYPPEIESAIYFCVLEALQNVAKHARGATRVMVTLNGETRGDLWFEVRDDGAGTDARALEGGAGITNMRDRLAAVHGSLHVTSRRGIGTRVIGHVATPVPAPQRSQRSR